MTGTGQFFKDNHFRTNAYPSGAYNRDPCFPTNFPSAWHQSLRDPGTASTWGKPVLGLTGSMRPENQGTLRPATAPTYPLGSRLQRTRPKGSGRHAEGRASAAHAAPSGTPPGAGGEGGDGKARSYLNFYDTTYDAFHNTTARLAVEWREGQNGQ